VRERLGGQGECATELAQLSEHRSVINATDRLELVHQHQQAATLASGEPGLLFQRELEGAEQRRPDDVAVSAPTTPRAVLTNNSRPSRTISGRSSVERPCPTIRRATREPEKDASFVRTGLMISTLRRVSNGL
jgi:hypothetical protein